MNSLTVREILFTLPNKSSYKINTNSTITIKSLKKIVIAAANLSSKNFKLIHNDVDYLLENPNNTIKQLFDDDEKILFQIHYEDSLSDKKNNIFKLNLGNKCYLHNFKFVYLYCYTCNKSICSQCVQENLHNHHNIIDKNDHLKKSENIICNIIDDIKNAGKKKFNLDLLSNVKENIEKVIYPNIIEKAKEAKDKIIHNINTFVDILSNSEINWQNELNNLESLCIEGLEELKQTQKIENLFDSDNIFPFLDLKITNLKNKKIEILENEMSFKLFEKVKDVSEKLKYTYEKLLNKMKFDLDDEITKNLLTSLKPLSREEIFELLYKENDVQNILITPQKSIVDKGNNNNSNSSSKKLFIFDGTTNSTQKENINQNFQKSTEAELGSPNRDGNKSIKKLKYQKFYTIVPNTSKIIEYNSDKNKISEICLKFSAFIGIKNFLPKSSILNDGKHLYISGGSLEKNESNSFILFNTQNLVRLPFMSFSRSNHTSLKLSNLYYCIGGVNNRTCEYFNSNDLTWQTLPSLNYSREKSNVLVFNNSNLYCFFGKYKEKKIQTEMEVLDLNIKKVWELLIFENTDKINQMLNGSSLLHLNSDEVILIGGKTNKDKYNKNVILLNTKKRTLNKIGENQKDYYFLENQSHFIGNNTYANFNSVNNLLFYFDLDKYYIETQQLFLKN